MRKLGASIGALLLLVAAAGASRPDDGSVLHRFRSTLAAAQTVEGEISVSVDTGGQKQAYTLHFSLARPQKAEVRLLAANGNALRRYISNGSQSWVVMDAQKLYNTQPTAAGALGQLALGGLPAVAFLSPEALTSAAPPRDLGKLVRDGKEYAVYGLDQTYPEHGSARLFFGADGMLAGEELAVISGTQTTQKSFWVRSFQLDAPLPVERFIFAPPPDFRPLAAAGAPKRELAVGQKAPEFQLPQPGGGMVSLSESLKNHRAVLLHFWFADCNTCRGEAPRLQSLYAELAPHGLQIIAVNARDSEERVRNYQEEMHWTFPVALGGQGAGYQIGKAYGVQSYPTKFVIGADGRILWRGQTFSLPAIRSALALAGVP